MDRATSARDGACGAGAGWWAGAWAWAWAYLCEHALLHEVLDVDEQERLGELGGRGERRGYVSDEEAIDHGDRERVEGGEELD